MQPPLALLDQLRLERRVPIARDIPRHGAVLGQHLLRSGAVAGVPAVTTLDSMLVVTQMLGHLGFEASLEHPLRETGQHPVGADQIQTLVLGLLHQLLSKLQLLLRPLPIVGRLDHRDTVVFGVAHRAVPPGRVDDSACQASPVTR